MKCQKCGCPLPEDSEFCQYCGSHIEPQSDLEVVAAPVETTPVEELVYGKATESSVDPQPEAAQALHEVSAPIVEPVAPVPSPAIEKVAVQSSNEKHKFCKKCGAAIDPNTKKCSGCSKQYFNAKRTVPIVLLSVLLIASIGLNVLQYLQGKEVSETVATQIAKIEKLEKDASALKSTISTKNTKIRELEAKVDELEKEVDELNDKNFDLFLDLFFYKEYAAIVPDDGRKRYHVYGCEDCDTSRFWIYNIEAAEQEGYYPCPKCY